MEVDVRNCLHGEIVDPSLGMIVELAVTAIVENRPLYQNPLTEPMFYRRYIRRWVQDEIDLEKAMASKQQADIASMRNY